MASLGLQSAAFAHAATLPSSVGRALAEAQIPLSSVSIIAQPVDASAATLAVNGTVPRNPASVIKLVTTLAALDRLGPAYSWETAFFSQAAINAGTLHGDLYLRGSGDPKLTYERFWILLRQLRDRGIREIRGDLVLDRSLFARTNAEPGDFDDQPLRPYNALPDALLFNFNTLTLHLRPEATTSGVSVTAEPSPDNLTIDNHLHRSPDAGCGDWRQQLTAIPINSPHAVRLVLTGDYPGACGERDWHIQAMSPDDLLGGVFRGLWHELGGTFSGQVREGLVPDGAQPIAVSPAPTLAEVVRDINKFSNNVLARQLFLTMGREAKEPDAASASAPLAPTTDADGDTAVRAWLNMRSIAMPGLVLGNGAGLARDTRVTAAGLANLLRYAWRSPVMPEFIASLPLSAVDGTMKKRLHDTAVAGRAHIKTGSLEGAKAMAGYLLDAHGRRWIVIFLVNDPRAAQAGQAMDEFLVWLAHGGNS